ncbi:hypothetical protein MKW98_026550, partial [Papaver atlanticum]
EHTQLSCGFWIYLLGQFIEWMLNDLYREDGVRRFSPNAFEMHNNFINNPQVEVLLPSTTFLNMVESYLDLECSHNGIRIKTYQGGNGYAKDWYFRNLNVDTASNPIITDQYYYAVAGACAPQNVTCEHFTGTSATQASVVLNCSPAIRCTDLTFNTIQLSPAKWGETVSQFVLMLMEKELDCFILRCHVCLIEK